MKPNNVPHLDPLVRPFAVAIGLIGALNIAFPRTYALYAIDHLSYLPLSFRIAWIIGALVALAGFSGFRVHKRFAEIAMVITAAALLVSLFVFRTRFPGLHGDGEDGGYPQYRLAASLSAYPNNNGRLAAFLADGLRHLLPRRPDFDYSFSNLLNNDYETQAYSILVTLLAGAVIIMAVTWWMHRRRLAPSGQVGLQWLCLCSPAMLGAYGHFDSYIVPSGFVLAWFFALLGVLRNPRSWRAGVLLGLVLLLALWAHGLMAILAGLTGVLAAWLLALRILARQGAHVHGICRFLGAPPLGLVLLFGMICGSTPGVLIVGRPDVLMPEVAGMRGMILFEKIASTLQVCLPTLLLAAVVAWSQRRALRHPRPIQVFAVFCASFTMGMMLTVHMFYGIKDEFIYSMLGLVALCGVVLLTLSCRINRRVLVYAGVLSAFLFVPRVYLYSNRLLDERFLVEMPHDPCWADRDESPYWILAQCQPLDTAEFRATRLHVLETGFRNPLPMWADDTYRVRSLALYAAWCCAFGETVRAEGALRMLAEISPVFLQETWRAPGVFGTDRYYPRAPWVARRLSARVLTTLMRERPDSQAECAELEAALATLQQTQPRPIRFSEGLTYSVYHRLYGSGYDYGKQLRIQDTKGHGERDRVALEREAQRLRMATELSMLPFQKYRIWRDGLGDGYFGEEPVVNMESPPPPPATEKSDAG